MTDACEHRRRTVTAFEARPVTMAGRELWRVKETLTCVKCGDATRRWSRRGWGASSARESLKRYGVATPDLPAPTNHKVKPPIEVALTSWPFPVSSHQEQT